MGHWFSVFGFRFSVFGFRFSVFGFRFSVFGFRFSVFGFRLPALRTHPRLLQLFGRHLIGNILHGARSIRARTTGWQRKHGEVQPSHGFDIVLGYASPGATAPSSIGRTPFPAPPLAGAQAVRGRRRPPGREHAKRAQPLIARTAWYGTSAARPKFLVAQPSIDSGAEAAERGNRH